MQLKSTVTHFSTCYTKSVKFTCCGLVEKSFLIYCPVVWALIRLFLGVGMLWPLLGCSQHMLLMFLSKKNICRFQKKKFKTILVQGLEGWMHRVIIAGVDNHKWFFFMFSCHFLKRYNNLLIMYMFLPMHKWNWLKSILDYFILKKRSISTYKFLNEEHFNNSLFG